MRSPTVVGAPASFWTYGNSRAKKIVVWSLFSGAMGLDFGLVPGPAIGRLLSPVGVCRGSRRHTYAQP